MKLRGTCAIFVMALFNTVSFAAHHAFDRAPLVDTNSISKWLSDSTSAPKTVEEFLSKLPVVYRSHFVLMYASRSLHRATPNAPRIIFFGPDARLLTAVSTDPADPRRNIIELIEFEPQKAKFSFHEITFGNSAPKMNHSPQKCQNCHGADLRPNWEPYDAWPGAYGSVHDKMAYGTHENKLFSKFLENYKQDSRLSSLPENFVMKHETFGGDPTYYTVSRGVGQSSVFSLLLSFANRERLVRLITESPNHSNYRNAITAALLGCPDSPETFIAAAFHKNHPLSYSAVLEDTRKKMLHDHARRVEQTATLQKARDLEEFGNDVDRFGLREKEIVRTAKLRYLLENRSQGSVPMNRWALGLHQDSYNFNDGVSGNENLIGHYVPVAFADAEPLKAKIEYRTIPYDGTSYSEQPGPSGGKDAFLFEAFDAPEPSALVCAELAAKN